MKTVETDHPACLGQDVRILTGIWMSSAETGELASANIADLTTGYLSAMEAMAQSNANVGSRNTSTAAPFSTRLRPLFDLQVLLDADRIWLRSIQWHAFDPTLDGSAEQSAAVNTALDTAAASIHDAYAMSRFRNGEIGGFQPNWFRPIFAVNGRNLYEELSDNRFRDGNKGDLSVGLPLPYCRDYEPALPVGGAVKATRIDVYGQAAQYINDEALWLRYPVQCVAEFYAL